MEVTADPVEAEAAEDEQRGDETIMELLEQFAHDSATLALREAELVAAEHQAEVRRGARDATAAAIAAGALGTAFLLANWAAVRALSDSLSGWRAPLALAAVWLVVGAAVATMPLARLRGVLHRFDGERASVADRERARDQAVQALRESLERLGGGLADEAQSRMVAAIVPSADGIVNTGEELLEASEELLDDMVEQVPGGSVVGQVIDVALIPGRSGVRVATTVLTGGPEG